MPVEIIGEVGTPGANREWISAQATLAIRHIVKVCGPPPQRWSRKSSGRGMNSAVIPRSFSSGRTPCAEHRGIIWKGVTLRLQLTRMAVNFLPAGQCRPAVRGELQL